MTAVAVVAGLTGAVQAAPGETWSGTLTVSEEVSREGADSSYDKSHVTTFSVSEIAGFDDDPYRQPLAGWSVSYQEQVSQGGRCPSGTTTIGDASGTDGELSISASGTDSILIEVVNYGSPGTFPAESTSTTCNEEEPSNLFAASTVNIAHQSFSVESSEDPQAEVLSGTVVRPITDGAITYQWELHRGENPSDGDDNVTGTIGNDVIELFGGNDVAFALEGNDKVYGGEGDDELHGDAGADLLIGGDAADQIFGGTGNDTLNGDGPNGLVHTEEKYSHAAGIGGSDFLFGGAGADRLTGGDGLDRFNGGPGRDICIVDSRREKRRAKGCEEIRLKRSR